MGCSQSKIENEEAVTRCKDRRHFIKLAVSSRAAFASAHSSYASSLKSFGAALSGFAETEVGFPQFPASSPARPSSSAIPAIAAPPSSFDIRPPPPPPNVVTAPLQRATTMPEKIIKQESKPAGPIITEEEEDVELENDVSLRARRRRRNSRIEDKPPPPRAEGHDDDDHALQNPPHNSAAWEYFFPSVENVPGTSLKDAEEVAEGEAEHQLSERKEGNRREVFEEKDRGGVDDGDGVGDERVPPLQEEVVVEPPPAPTEEAAMAMAATSSKALKKVKLVQPAVSAVEGKRSVKQSVNLMRVFSELDDHFLNASESAREVSKMLEATRLHYHSNFADNRGHIDHSARVMQVITWNRSFRGTPNMNDRRDSVDLEEHETHATVLDKLLAWEKKLYVEVKASELMKYEYRKKVASLNKLKKRGTNPEAVEKAKATVSHLHTKYIVDVQSLDSTVSEINRLRDHLLYPRLVQLVDGMATMWGIMHFHHEKQSSIVTSLTLLDISQSPTETSEQHHEQTYQLLLVVQQWQSHFEKLINHQKEYIKALNNWLKLNLVRIESDLKENAPSPPRVRSPPIQRLLLAWHDHLEKLPDEVARTVITNFAAVIDTIFHHQEEEMALKKKCEETRKELTRKTRQFEDWYPKYMEKKIPAELDPNRTEGDNGPDKVVTERKSLVEQLKKRLEGEEEAYASKCLQVRQKSLGCLKNRLPELFKAMSNFARECSKMYSELRSISQNQSIGQNSS